MVRQRASHDEEIAGDLHVEALHELQVFEVLLGDGAMGMS